MNTDVKSCILSLNTYIYIYISVKTLNSEDIVCVKPFFYNSFYIWRAFSFENIYKNDYVLKN